MKPNSILSPQLLSAIRKVSGIFYQDYETFLGVVRT